jgi:hypothetical protein
MIEGAVHFNLMDHHLIQIQRDLTEQTLPGMVFSSKASRTVFEGHYVLLDTGPMPNHLPIHASVMLSFCKH